MKHSNALLLSDAIASSLEMRSPIVDIEVSSVFKLTLSNQTL